MGNGLNLLDVYLASEGHGEIQLYRLFSYNRNADHGVDGAEHGYGFEEDD